ncbi:nuclear protein snf7 [Plasmodium yoelii yoelii]|uniref:Nuclear protein snf7 n=1 Tax=Plasmodium yoelii yoelii TaxID=73239 RepID=Q7RQ28_PLAYO|nr:nuclear protein snf7 [Plasmodium yoelii yoelii]
MEVKQKVQQNQMNNAKILLKRKKLYEQEIENILNNRLTLEDNMINLENMHLHKLAVNALSYAANTHKKFNNEINTQKVEKIIDTLQEHKDIQEEINQALCFNPLNNVDDDEIDKELNLLKEQSIQEKINTPVNNISEVVIGINKTFLMSFVFFYCEIESLICLLIIFFIHFFSDKENVSISNTIKQATTVNEESDDEELKELIGEMT